MTYSQIEKLANEVIQEVDSTIPVDVVKIAKFQKIDVFVIPFDETLNADPSGLLVENNGKWAILVNINDSITRQRFTIAHEVGHFLIHKGQQFVDEFNAGETFYRDGEDTKEEREANYFAACLLMPADKLVSIWPDCKDPKDAANRFNVSEVSMTYRLKNLGILTIKN